jgi:predicted nucleic acid-binding protein
VIVVSDTTPLRYLGVVGGLDWLPALFGEIVCPPEVLAECRHERAPASLRAWAAAPPLWLRIEPVSEAARALPVELRLDAGETAALCLARELQADLLLLDERRGRAVAARLGLAVTGTLGVLVEAALRGLTDFEAGLTRLTTLTNFRVSESVIAAARARLAAGRASTENSP